MTRKEKTQVNDIIDLLIGSETEHRQSMEGKELSQIINSNFKYRAMRADLMAIAEKYGVKTMQVTLITCGNDAKGYTPTGKKVLWIRNSGWTMRSRYCGTLKIEGETIYTSGSIAKCFAYMINN